MDTNAYGEDDDGLGLPPSPPRGGMALRVAPVPSTTSNTCISGVAQAATSSSGQPDGGPEVSHLLQ